MTNVEVTSPYVSGPWGIALVCAAVVLAAWGLYRRSCPEAPRAFRWLLVGLRLAALALLALAIVRPVLRYDRVARREGRVAILLDRSRSMAVRDSAGGETRFASARGILQGGALAEIENLYRVETIAFADRAAPLEGDLEALRDDGEGTSLAAAFGAIGTEGGPLEAVIVLTDGCETLPPPVLESDRVPAVPVHAIVLGSGGEDLEDIRVDRIEAERDVLVGNAFPFRTTVRLRGRERRLARIEVLRKRCGAPPAAGGAGKGEAEGSAGPRDAAGPEAGSIARTPAPAEAERVLAVDRSLEPGANPVELEIAADAPGDWIYSLRVPPLEGEVFEENNERHVEIRASARKLQVLYHEGTPRWEYKFLGSALRRDRDIALVSTLRTSEEQVYQQGASPAPLRGGLPEDRAGFRPFDAIILGDLGRGGIDPARLEDLRAYVAEDRGGLIFLGGPKAWPAAVWRGTPMEALLPVRLAAGVPVAGPLAVLPTPSGLGHPVTAGIAERIDAARPPFALDRVFAVGAVKPAAIPLLLARPPKGGPQPLLVLHSYGEGRVAAMATDAAWRWVMGRTAEGGEDLFGRLWGQIVRWAAGRVGDEEEEAPFRIERRVVSVGERVKIRVKEDAKIRVTDPRNAAVEAALSGEGPWRDAVWTAEVPGAYRIGIEGAGDPRDTIIAEPRFRERERLDPDRDLLARLAQATGGRVWQLPEVGRIPRAIAASTPGAVTRVELSLERTRIAGAAFALYALALSIEWWLRRRRYEI